MRALLKLTIAFIVALPLCVAGALFLAIDGRPLIDRRAEITPADIEQAKRILDKNDPRRLKSGTVRTVTVKQDEIDLAANYLLHRFAAGSAQVELGDRVAQIKASLGLPLAGVRQFVNVQADLTGGSGLPQMSYLKLGGLYFPGWLANRIAQMALDGYFGAEEVRTVSTAIEKIAIDQDQLRLTYRWHPELADTLRKALVSPDDEQRLRVYQEHLVTLSRQFSTEPVSLVELLVPSFALAQQRSVGGDPVAENRAAILMLMLYVNGRSSSAIIPEAKNWPRPHYKNVYLSGRDDFPKHFIISAALSAFAGTPLADAVGVYKEIADTHGGSGFSFNDIAADRAGVVLGEEAVRSASAAIKIQRRIAAGVTETYIMPVTADLAEFMSEETFKSRYGGVGAPAYNQVVAMINRRVSELPLYR